MINYVGKQLSHAQPCNMLTKQAKETLIATIGSTALIALVIGLSMGLPRRRAPLAASSAAGVPSPYEMMPPCIKAGFNWENVIRTYVEPVVVRSLPDFIGRTHVLSPLPFRINPHATDIVTYSHRGNVPYDVTTGEGVHPQRNSADPISMSAMSFETIAYCRFFLQTLKVFWTPTINNACYGVDNAVASAAYLTLPPAIGFVFLNERTRFRNVRFISQEPARSRTETMLIELYRAMWVRCCSAQQTPLGLVTKLGMMMESHLNMHVLIPTVCGAAGDNGIRNGDSNVSRFKGGSNNGGRSGGRSAAKG
jgi:hypothetical protein